MKVSEIRQKLIESGKFSEEEVNNIKGKSKLLETYNATFGENLLDNLDIVEETVTIEEESNDPSYLSPEWQTYVLSLLNEDEMKDGHPLVHGLRRLAEKLLGPILVSSPVEFVHQGPDPGHCSCRYEIKIKWIRDEEGNVSFGDYGIRTYGAMAGSYYGNTDGEFAVYPEAIAETRAELRSLRKALRLSVCGAEEISKKAIETIKEAGKQIEWESMDKCDEIQSNVIIKKCAQLNISLDKLLLSRGISDFNTLTKEQASDLILYINKVQTNNEQIPEELRG